MNLSEKRRKTEVFIFEAIDCLNYENLIVLKVVA